MVGGVALMVAAVLVFGRSGFFKGNQRYVAFFDGSVQGLSVGSPVTFDGVEIGTVISMRLIFRAEERKIYLPVVIEVDRDKVEGISRHVSDDEARLEIERRGLRAQLRMVSIVTGQQQVALKMAPETPLRLVGMDTQYPEIPTVPSPIDQISQQLEEIPLQEISMKTLRVMNGLDAFVNATGEMEGLNAAQTLLAEARRVLVAIEGKVQAVDTAVITSEMQAMLRDFNILLENVDKTVRGDSPVMRSIAHSMRELELTIRQFRQLAELLQRQPEAMLRGKRGN